MSILQTIERELRALVRGGDVSLAERVRSDARYAQLVARFGQTMLALRARGLTTLADIVERRAEEHPDHEAVRCGKSDLVREGFDPDVVNDPLFFLDPSSHTYRPLDRAHYERIVSGQLRI